MAGDWCLEIGGWELVAGGSGARAWLSGGPGLGWLTACLAGWKLEICGWGLAWLVAWGWAGCLAEGWWPGTGGWRLEIGGCGLVAGDWWLGLAGAG